MTATPHGSERIGRLELAPPPAAHYEFGCGKPERSSLLITDDHRVYIGDVKLEAGFVTVTGSRRRRINGEFEFGPQGTWIFPARRVDEIREPA